MFTATMSAQPGPQTDFLRSPADICIYGGAAGGGKTVGLILEPLRHVRRVANFTAVFFRRTTPQITNPGALWDESLNFYPQVGHANGTTRTISTSPRDNNNPELQSVGRSYGPARHCCQLRVCTATGTAAIFGTTSMPWLRSPIMLVIGGLGRPILLAAALQLSDRHT